MKKLMSVLAILLLIGCGIAYGQETATNTNEGLFAKFAIGQDNAYLCSSGNCFLAIGGGIDILGYTKQVGTKGSILDLKLHGMALAKVTDNESGPVFGAAVTLDAIKLITGTGVSILIPQLNVLLGPAVGYDVDKGRVVYGGMFNISYTF